MRNFYLSVAAHTIVIATLPARTRLSPERLETYCRHCLMRQSKFWPRLNKKQQHPYFTNKNKIVARRTQHILHTLLDDMEEVGVQAEQATATSLFYQQEQHVDTAWCDGESWGQGWTRNSNIPTLPKRTSLLQRRLNTYCRHCFIKMEEVLTHVEQETATYLLYQQEQHYRQKDLRHTTDIAWWNGGSFDPGWTSNNIPTLPTRTTLLPKWLEVYCRHCLMR